MSEARLNEYDKNEWFDIARKLRPGLTEREYEEMWRLFIEAKEEHERKKGLQ